MIQRITLPITAFALMAAFTFSATSAHAFNSDLLEKIDVDLTDTQISALEQAHELRKDGASKDEIKTFLQGEGIDQMTKKEIRKAIHEVQHGMREGGKTALKNNDYSAFLAAITDSPLSDVIKSQADFETLKTANDLKKSGDYEGARELMTELGITKPARHNHRTTERERIDMPNRSR